MEDGKTWVSLFQTALELSLQMKKRVVPRYEPFHSHHWKRFAFSSRHRACFTIECMWSGVRMNADASTKKKKKIKIKRSINVRKTIAHSSRQPFVFILLLTLSELYFLMWNKLDYCVEACNVRMTCEMPARPISI